jgi:hypothetical protein
MDILHDRDAVTIKVPKDIVDSIAITLWEKTEELRREIAERKAIVDRTAEQDYMLSLYKQKLSQTLIVLSQLLDYS